MKHIFRRNMVCILTALLISGLSVGVFAADPTVKIVSPDTLPEAGKTFTVSVEISGNPGLCSMQYTLAFDDSVVDCKSIQLGSALDGMMLASNPNAATGAIIAGASADPVSGNGTLAEYTFEVLKAGDPKFALTDYEFTGNNYMEIGQTNQKVTITRNPDNQSGKLQVSDSWCQAHGATQFVLARYAANGQMIGYKYAKYSGSDIELTWNYAEKDSRWGVLAMDASGSPVCEKMVYNLSVS